MLLQEHVDPAEVHPVQADVPPLGARRRVGRDQHHLVARVQQRRGQHVVAQAAAAVHVPGTGGDVCDSHRKPYNEPSWEPVKGAPPAAAGEAAGAEMA